MEWPNKSLLLDAETRNIPRHRLRSELLASRKVIDGCERVCDECVLPQRINYAHQTYDADCDGVVSPLDMKYSKSADSDSDGLLARPELRKLRYMMARVTNH